MLLAVHPTRHDSILERPRARIGVILEAVQRPVAVVVAVVVDLAKDSFELAPMLSMWSKTGVPSLMAVRTHHQITSSGLFFSVAEGAAVAIVIPPPAALSAAPLPVTSPLVSHVQVVRIADSSSTPTSSEKGGEVVVLRRRRHRPHSPQWSYRYQFDHGRGDREWMQSLEDQPVVSEAVWAIAIVVPISSLNQ